MSGDPKRLAGFVLREVNFGSTESIARFIEYMAEFGRRDKCPIYHHPDDDRYWVARDSVPKGVTYFEEKCRGKVPGVKPTGTMTITKIDRKR